MNLDDTDTEQKRREVREWLASGNRGERRRKMREFRAMRVAFFKNKDKTNSKTRRKK